MKNNCIAIFVTFFFSLSAMASTGVGGEMREAGNIRCIEKEGRAVVTTVAHMAEDFCMEDHDVCGADDQECLQLLHEQLKELQKVSVMKKKKAEKREKAHEEDREDVDSEFDESAPASWTDCSRVKTIYVCPNPIDPKGNMLGYTTPGTSYCAGFDKPVPVDMITAERLSPDGLPKLTIEGGGDGDFRSIVRKNQRNDQAAISLVFKQKYKCSYIFPGVTMVDGAPSGQVPLSSTPAPPPEEWEWYKSGWVWAAITTVTGVVVYLILWKTDHAPPLHKTCSGSLAQCGG